MSNENREIWISQTLIIDKSSLTTGDFVQLLGETYYRITNHDQMPPFFMSLVSNADHWLFIASNGGLTAGRLNAESALFPYETEDKIIAHSEMTGGKTMVRVRRNGRLHHWEPFSNRYAGLYACERHIYKNIYGNKLVFEEVNHDLQLSLRTAWRTSDRFGFVRTSWLSNDSQENCQIELLDGLQNLLPYGATAALQNSFSSLLNAYKRNELEPETGLGIFSLSATLTDRAEPSESLQATVAWQVGLDNPVHLLSSEQIDGFRYGRFLTPEHDLCGKAGAYLVSSTFELPPKEEKRWHIVADVNQDSANVTRRLRFLGQDQETIEAQIEADIAQNSSELVGYVAAADGLQQTAQQTTTSHHFANVLFNIMRGGIFADGYQVARSDFLDFVQVRNRFVLSQQADWFDNLPTEMRIHELYDRAAQTGEADLIRLCYEYLPLTFSRRHGDPSRPWNRFSINIRKPDGSLFLGYQGNWRDIFQNWEPLALSYPAYVEGLIAKFLNGTTADGYNPYRVMRAGIEWEVPEPDNPWANIGYWNDHQIIYLQKLLEIADQVQPGSLVGLWNQPIFAYVNVPYRLKPYSEMLADWYNTIDFIWEDEEKTEKAVAQMGTDGRLMRDSSGSVLHVTMIEKLLVLLLAKLTNLVPEGGIWMNTQRPEWNDANNALVGKGLSVVTVAYLRRFIAFWQRQLDQPHEPREMAQTFAVNTAVATLFTTVQTIFADFQPLLARGFRPEDRRAMMDALGTAVSAYRSVIYQSGIPTQQSHIAADELRGFLALAQSFIEHTLQANRRPDGLEHTYNILRLEPQGAAIENLYLMLEGQVAYLSSGVLSAKEALALLHSLRHSDLYRPDQHAYMLYPNRKLPGFRQKNNVAAAQAAGFQLVAALNQAGDRRLLVQDAAGEYHFNGRFRNANDVADILDELAQEPDYAELVAAERSGLLALFEAAFNHSAYTGRSGTFFAYEGLGSIYWHMVSKLLLAVQEVLQQAIRDEEDSAVTEALAAAYYDIRAGLGFNKSPAAYGAFPTDPYSHTPLGSGARQPGMTGQVKEEILTRWGELGVAIEAGQLHFATALLQANEFCDQAADFTYLDMAGQAQTIALPAHSLAFTYCQVPIIYSQSDRAAVEVEFTDGRSETVGGSRLDRQTTQQIFDRTGQVALVRVLINSSTNAG